MPAHHAILALSGCVSVSIRASFYPGATVTEPSSYDVMSRQPDRRHPRFDKRFGQHHLREPALCGPLVRFLAPEGRSVVEVGPGGGVLTRALLAAGAQVVACEVDLPWAFHVRRALPEADLRVVAYDALAWPWQRMPSETLVAGNLPFNVGTPIIERLLLHHARIPKAAFMVQEEVADRLVAQPGDRAYGALSVLVASRAKAVKLGVVKPGSFQPPPKVAGAYVGLDLCRPPLPEAAMPTLVEVIRAAFSTRRKTVRNTLGRVYGRDAGADMIAAAGVDPSARAEVLSLEDFVQLARAIQA